MISEQEKMPKCKLGCSFGKRCKMTSAMFPRCLRSRIQLSLFSTITGGVYAKNGVNSESTYSASSVAFNDYLQDTNINIPEHSEDSKTSSTTQSHTIKLLNSQECMQLFPMSLAIRCQAEAFSSVYKNVTHEPSRLILNLNESDDTLFKPAYSDANAMGIKIISVRPNNPKISNNTIESLTGCILLFNKETGQPLCFMDAKFVTARRTAAGSGLATDLFSKKNSKNVIIFGAGNQANEHIRAITTVRGKTIEKFFIINRNIENGKKLCVKYENTLLRNNGKKIEFIAIGLKDFQNDLELQKRLLESCDIIATTTNAESPLFNGNYLNERNGVHINCIGAYKPNMIEIDDNTVNKCQLFVDSEKAFYCGDLSANESGLKKKENKDYIEIGEITFNLIGKNTKKYGEPGDDRFNNEMTLFESVGVSAQDLHSAYCIYQQACQQGVGTDVSL